VLKHELEPDDPQLVAAKAGVYVLSDVHAVVVSPAHRAAAPTLSPTHEPGPTGSLEELDARLEQTPNVAAYRNPGDWPGCCGHLTTLIAVNPDRAELTTLEHAAGSLNNLWWPLLEGPNPELCDITWNAELAEIRKGGRVSEGVHVFHCQVCGALYGEYSNT
jgi:hypothetical protein